MRKLVLTRRAGESVKLVEANGKEWLVSVTPHRRIFSKDSVDLFIEGDERADFGVTLKPYQSYAFAGGSLELRPTKRRWPGQAVLAFDFPRDVKIVRTEIA